MAYTIEHISFHVRETKPARFPSALGKKGQGAGGGERVTSPLCHVRMMLRGDGGETTWATSADRLSVRWLDKRPGRSKTLKLRELAALIHFAAERYRANATFDNPFQQWHARHTEIMAQGRRQNQEDLTSSFASALLERAMIDGVCRLHQSSLLPMLREDRLGFRAGELHPALDDPQPKNFLPARPKTRIGVRHTVGLYDPLSDEDWPAAKRQNDGQPETFAECIKKYGLRYFKIKISGDVDRDLARLARIWELLPLTREPVVTLDANEAFEDVDELVRFVKRLESEQLGLMQHIALIEQPLPRRMSFSPEAGRAIRRLGAIKPVIIDEADGSLDALPRAIKLGYAGASHKNCKGVFKSLAARALAVDLAHQGHILIQSGEDLQNLPVVPLQQDFVTVGVLGLAHCERNGHHYNFGLSMLSEKDRTAAVRRHRDLYTRQGDNWFLNIKDGAVETASLHQAPGFGVWDEPDWKSMLPLDRWLAQRESE